jgi:hypothetical protein
MVGKIAELIGPSLPGSRSKLPSPNTHQENPDFSEPLLPVYQCRNKVALPIDRARPHHHFSRAEN